MGGNALLKEMPEVKRLTRKEWDNISTEVSRLVTRTLGLYQTYFRTTPQVSEKSDFGDIDFYLAAEEVDENSWRDYVAKALQSKAVVRSENSDCTSFEFKGHQIDIITLPKRSFDFSYNYFSYGGIGNYVGKIARKLGFKFGHTGMFLEVRDGTHLLDTLLVTENFHEALSLLGFPSNFGYSFSTFDSVYRYVANSKFYSKEIFTSDLNNRDRARDLKNAMYNGFLTYIEKPGINNRYTYEDGKYPAEISARMKKDYGPLLSEFKKIRENNETTKLLKAKFNGDVIQAVTKMGAGPRIGEFSKAFRNQFESIDSFTQFVLSSSEDTLHKRIASFFEPWLPAQEKLEKKQKAAAVKAQEKKAKEEAQAKKALRRLDKDSRRKELRKRREFEEKFDKSASYKNNAEYRGTLSKLLGKDMSLPEPVEFAAPIMSTIDWGRAGQSTRYFTNWVTTSTNSDYFMIRDPGTTIRTFSAS